MGLPAADFALIDGERTPRPKGQNIRPKAFKGRPFPLAMIAYSEPTDRFVLWYIQHYKYAFNVFHTSDFSNWMKPAEGKEREWIYGKYLILVKSLFDRHLIKYGDKKRLTIKITLKGQLHRLTTHPQWIFIQLFIAAVLAFLVGYTILLINRSTQSKQEQGGQIKGKSETPIYDSGQYIQPQIELLKAKDSVSFLTDTTKTRAKITTPVKKAQNGN